MGKCSVDKNNKQGELKMNVLKLKHLLDATANHFEVEVNQEENHITLLEPEKRTPIGFIDLTTEELVSLQPKDQAISGGKIEG